MPGAMEPGGGGKGTCLPRNNFWVVGGPPHNIGFIHKTKTYGFNFTNILLNVFKYSFVMIHNLYPCVI